MSLTTVEAQVADYEAAVLTTADRQFYRRGIAAVTMADIRDDAGVSLRRLYSLYPSKAELVSAWLEFRHRRWMANFTSLVDSRIAEGDSPVDAVFAELETWMLETDFRGCGFINTHAEASELTDEQRSIIGMHKRSLADYLATIITADGDAADGIAPLVDGAIVQASIFRNTEPIRAAHRLARHVENNRS